MEQYTELEKQKQKLDIIFIIAITIFIHSLLYMCLDGED